MWRLSLLASLSLARAAPSSEAAGDLSEVRAVVGDQRLGFKGSLLALPVRFRIFQGMAHHLRRSILAFWMPEQSSLNQQEM